ncbi:hypothetical protein M5D98_11720 [Mesorhizobium opportunistum]|uniref:hypothetical protein n=1 Tax=Mesorhizobium opportunistum TaxID=593909 RepID=UPI00201850E6|nr:hypothetical protein [Mesorhizobium opportunistum]UQS66946.1 hypothetical protein M5D98_11720 [Mesorhizobium opportunistum]
MAELLTGRRYRRLSQPLQVAGLTFDVAGAFVGLETAADLVVMVDTATQGERKALQQIEGIARALDVVRSRRSLTTVIVGPRPVGRSMELLSQVSRVLPVGEAADEADLKDRLAILLPLVVPVSNPASHDLGTASEAALANDPVALALMNASASGENAVRDLFHEMLAQSLRVADDEDAADAS